MINKLATMFASMSIECRHGIYVWWLTFACLTGIMLITLRGLDGVVAQHAVDSLSNIMTTVVCSYLGIEMLSRSQLLNKFAERMGGTQSVDKRNVTEELK